MSDGTGPATFSASVCAVVVTYNRIELLECCLDAVVDQTRPVDHILVIDNASTDGTADMVRTGFPQVELRSLTENQGGAGGFHEGLARAHSLGHDWLWLMDDDTIPMTDTLERLLAGAARAPVGRKPLLLSSQVLWKDGSLHPMNNPVPRWRWLGELALGAERGLVLVRNATFVSVAIRREAIDRFGLPLRHYFLWTDDVEYTSRVLRRERGYLVPDSRVWHWTTVAHTAVEGADPNRFYYHVRNSLLFLRGSSYGWLERLDYLRYWVRTLVAFLRAQRWRRAAVLIVFRGLRDGLQGEAR